MEKAKKILRTTGILIFLFCLENITGSITFGQETPKPTTTQTKPKSTTTTSKSTQTKPKTTTTKPKTTTTKPKTTTTKPKTTTTKPKTPATKPKTTTTTVKTEPAKKKDPSVVTIGSQNWAVANLNVSTFRNGDTIPEAKSYDEWVAAGKSGKPAWCYYNNDPSKGEKYGKLYNWYAVNDPRELAPAGWSLASEADWAELSRSLGGLAVSGAKMKTTSGWTEGYHGTNESGFGALPGGYRIENGLFKNFGSIATWWSTSENNTATATDHYIGQGSSLTSSSTPKQRGQSVRCIRK